MTMCEIKQELIEKAREEIARLLKRFEERTALIPDLQARVHDLLHADCCPQETSLEQIVTERNLLKAKLSKLERVRAAAEAFNTDRMRQNHTEADNCKWCNLIAALRETEGKS